MQPTNTTQAEATLLEIAHAVRHARNNQAAFTVRASLAKTEAMRQDNNGAAAYWRDAAARHLAAAADLRAAIAADQAQEQPQCTMSI